MTRLTVYFPSPEDDAGRLLTERRRGAARIGMRDKGAALVAAAMGDCPAELRRALALALLNAAAEAVVDVFDPERAQAALGAAAARHGAVIGPTSEIRRRQAEALFRGPQNVGGSK